MLKLIHFFVFSFLIVLPHDQGYAMEDLSLKSPSVGRSNSIPIVEEIEEIKDLIIPSSQPSSKQQDIEETFLTKLSLSGMPFKIGFEFQVGSSICPWALNDNKVQKKEIFSVFTKENDMLFRLWHVVVDDGDIEFVTDPFTYNQRVLLNKCVTSISLALDNLKGSINKGEKVTFKSWLESLQQLFTSDVYSIPLSETEVYKDVKDKFLVPASSLPWEPYFSPQATIQHPLEYTIPLYFSLFGFDTPEMFNFTVSLPLRDSLIDAQKNGDDEKFQQIVAGYKNKMNGLVFLHALTISQMIPVEKKVTDALLLSETLEAFNTCGQVDAKLKLLIMSRRPFSAMYNDIKTGGGYFDYFMALMNNNLGFRHAVSYLGETINYAEQYFYEETGEPIDLRSGNFTRFFENQFLMKNRDIIDTLLCKGIVSTAMIKNFKKDVDDIPPIAKLFEGDNYFKFALTTVETPQDYRPAIDAKNRKIIYERCPTDILSPPVFLDIENSMGRYRRPLAKEDKKYGEAIIEIRGIRNVGPWFFKKCQLNLEENQSKFLVYPATFIDQSLILFDYLTRFDMIDFERDIFYLGMPYALQNYR